MKNKEIKNDDGSIAYKEFKKDKPVDSKKVKDDRTIIYENNLYTVVTITMATLLITAIMISK